MDIVGGVLPGQIALMLTSKPASVLSCLVSQLIHAVGFLRSAGASKVKVKIICLLKKSAVISIGAAVLGISNFASN